jgi:hypothetical protein
MFSTVKRLMTQKFKAATAGGAALLARPNDPFDKGNIVAPLSTWWGNRFQKTKAIPTDILLPGASDAVALQGYIQVLDQMIFTERLVQEANGASLDHTSPYSLVREGGNKYYGHTVTIGNQPVLQLDSAQAGHLNVGDQARRELQMARSEEFLGRTKRLGLVAEGPHKAFCGLTYGFIVVNN